MNKLLFGLGMIAACAVSSTALADHHEQAADDKPAVEVLSVGKDGKPDRIRIDGFEYQVCKGDQKDGCINPQAAGLDGNKQIEYWPCQPASEIDSPLPIKKPANLVCND